MLGETVGKTTLMNILTGLYKPDSGSMLIDNQLKVFHNPREANKNGVDGSSTFYVGASFFSYRKYHLGY